MVCVHAFFWNVKRQKWTSDFDKTSNRSRSRSNNQGMLRTIIVACSIAGAAAFSPALPSIQRKCSCTSISFIYVRLNAIYADAGQVFSQGARGATMQRRGSQSRTVLSQASSQAVPFLPRPTNLDGSLVGDVGFDPLGFSNNFDPTWLQVVYNSYISPVIIHKSDP